jgi:hypothetical protein
MWHSFAEASFIERLCVFTTVGGTAAMAGAVILTVGFED